VKVTLSVAVLCPVPNPEDGNGIILGNLANEDIGPERNKLARALNAAKAASAGERRQTVAGKQKLTGRLPGSHGVFFRDIGNDTGKGRQKRRVAN